MRTRLVAVLMAVLLVGASCGEDTGSSGVVRLYTSVTQNTVDAVVAAFEGAHPGVAVEVFRAPTGELNARIAAEQREGGVRATVLWLTDPLSMQAFDAAGLLLDDWEPDGAAALDPGFRSERFWGTRLLDLVIVHQPGLEPVPSAWSDLIDAATAGGVAMPDPGFAGSAFAALAYFALTDGYGIEFYEALAEAGGVQVAAPGDVVTGVAEGRFAAGVTLSSIARGAIDDGSPLVMVWPEPGAIAVYSPIAVVGEAADLEAAQAFAEFVLTEPAQEAIGATGWRPVLAGVPGPDGGPSVTLDWSIAYDRQEELLDAYRAIFGG